MNRALKIVILSLFVISVAAWADDNPLIGAWKINLAKTKYNVGTPPKNQVITYQMIGDALKLTAQIDNAQGHVTNSYTAKYDGKDYPFTSTAPDAVAGQTVRLKRIDTHIVERVAYLKGKKLTTEKWEISKDGKTRTVTQSGVSPQGQPVDNVLVYEKQ